MTRSQGTSLRLLPHNLATTWQSQQPPHPQEHNRKYHRQHPVMQHLHYHRWAQRRMKVWGPGKQGEVQLTVLNTKLPPQDRGSLRHNSRNDSNVRVTA